MELSDAGAHLIVLREGFRNEAYLDSKKIPTIGVGHTGPEVHLGLIWTDQMVEDAFKKDCRWAIRAVNKVLSPLNQNQFDALVSFVFNIGESQWYSSTMKKMLDVGDYTGAVGQFDRWHKPTDIITRRNGEREQFKGTAYKARLDK